VNELKASIILPCYNRARLLPLSLASMKSQSLSLKDYEVLIIDDGSTDDTSSVVRAHLWENARYFRKPNGGLSSARNHAATRARAKVLIFSDPDMILCPDFVRRHLAHHLPGSTDVVIGRKKEVVAHLPWWAPRWPTALLLRKLALGNPDAFRKVASHFFKGKMSRILSENDVASKFHLVERRSQPCYMPEPPADFTHMTIPWVFMCGGNVSISAEMFQRTGGFDENFTGWGLEDIELAYRLHNNGARFIYEPEAVNYHQTHSFSLSGNDLAVDRNLRYFIDKHPRREVELHADFIKGQISLEEYDGLVRQYYGRAAPGAR